MTNISIDQRSTFIFLIKKQIKKLGNISNKALKYFYFNFYTV